MTEFKRDMDRYIVIKRSDLIKAQDENYIPPGECGLISHLAGKVALMRQVNGKAPLRCVVVESDWPEYERVWQMIEARVTGKPLEEITAPGRVETEINWAEGARIEWREGTRWYPGVVSRVEEKSIWLTDQHGETEQYDRERAEIRARDYRTSGEIAEEECLNQLPEWAVARSDGTLKVGLQLCTKDGRRCGNAHIIRIVKKFYGNLYYCLTDAGNLVRLTEVELDEMFTQGDYIAAPEEVVRRFSKVDVSEDE